MKNYLRLLLIIVSFGYVLNVAQAKIPEDIRQAEKAVWKLKLSNFMGNGTAFFIGPKHVVTNFHVISAGKDESYKSRSIKDLYLTQGYKRLKISKVLYASAVDDLAILETEEPVSEYLKLSEKVPSGSLFALGYPAGVKKTLIHLEEYGVFDNGHDYQMTMDKIGVGGISGSPVLDGQKKAIGVAQRTSSNLFYVIKVSKLEDLKRGFIGLDCSNLSLSLCIEQEIKNLKEKAEEGDFLAQHILADMYFEGIGVKKDKVKALDWMSKAANQGDILALNEVAGVVEKDDKEAYKWFLEAANRGDAMARINLAIIYYFGIGVKEDKEEAFRICLEVVNQGYAPAQFLLSFMYLTGRGVDKDYRKAFDWMLKWAKLEILKWYSKLVEQDYVYVTVRDGLDGLNYSCRKVFQK